MIIKRIQTEEAAQMVKIAELHDKHDMPPATHVILNEKGEILGSLSFIPTALVWMDSEKNNGCSSKRMEEQLSSIFASQGHGIMMIPCKKDSKYNEQLQQLGYVKVDDFDLFFKKL